MSGAEEKPSYQALSVNEPRTPTLLKNMSHPVSNTGSTARDHLANERTFLSWLRTAVSLLSIALAIAKFAPGGLGLILGVCFALLGSMILAYSGARFFEVMRALERGEYKINTGAVTALLLFAGVIAFLIVLAIVLQASGEDVLDN